MQSPWDELTTHGDLPITNLLDSRIWECNNNRRADSPWLVWPHKTLLHPPEIEDAEIVNRLEFFVYNTCLQSSQVDRGQAARESGARFD